MPYKIFNLCDLLIFVVKITLIIKYFTKGQYCDNIFVHNKYNKYNIYHSEEI